MSCPSQFTDTVSGYFFQRIHFDYSNIITGRGNTPILEQAIADLAIRFDLDWNIAYSNKIKRVAVLVSKIDHCLFDLLIRRKSEELKCEIPVVVSNHPDLKHIAGEELATDDSRLCFAEQERNKRTRGGHEVWNYRAHWKPQRNG